MGLSQQPASRAAEPRPASLIDRLAVLVATAGGVGYAPAAPGTAASALTALLLWLIPLSRAGLAVALLALVVLGTLAAHRAERVLGGKDPGAIVVDEVAGMVLSAVPFVASGPALLVGFVLFRVFDVVKPFPARDAQRLPGGLGVMVDDLVAGLYALSVVALLRAGVGWP